MVDVSAEALDLAKKKLAEKTKSWTGGVCEGCCLSIDGKTVLQEGHTACHSWVGYQFSAITGQGRGYSYKWDAKYNKSAEPFLVLTSHTKKRSLASDEATDAIILWMASDESPFSQFILNRDDPESLTNDGAIILCGPGGANHAQAMWMCKALRYITEGSKALDVWHLLYTNGVNPLLAMLICTYISDVKGSTFTAATVSGHVSVFGGYGQPEADVHGLMSFSFNPEANSTTSMFKMSDVDRKLKGLDGIGKKAKGGNENAATKIKGFCKAFVKDDGWGGKITGEGVDGAELVKRVLEWQEELGGYDKAGRFPNGPAVPDAAVVAPVVEKLPDSTTVYLDVDL